MQKELGREQLARIVGESLRDGKAERIPYNCRELPRHHYPRTWQTQR